MGARGIMGMALAVAGLAAAAGHAAVAPTPAALAAPSAPAAHEPPEYDIVHSPLPQLAPPRGTELDRAFVIGDTDGDKRGELALLVDDERGFDPLRSPDSRWSVTFVDRRVLLKDHRLDLKRTSTIDLGVHDYTPRLTPVGDVNGDGLADVAFSNRSSVWIVLGKRGRTHVDLGRGKSPRLIRIRGLHAAGVSAHDVPLVALGDLDGDGRGEIAAGSPGSSPHGRHLAGSVYLIRGTATSKEIQVGRKGTTLARLDGPTPNTRAGTSLATLGDFDGDGHADLAVGTNRHQPQRDRTWITTAAGPSRDLGSQADTSIAGLSGRGQGELQAAGDFNGDGLADLGAHGPNTQAYLIYGAREPSTLDVRSLGARATRFSAYDAPEAAGDVNGDGRPDLVVFDRIVLGAEGGPDLARGWKTEGFELIPLGDVDRDGRADLLTSSSGTPCWSDESGYAFVPGTGTPPKPPPYGRPTSGNDRLIGTSRGDVIDGDNGNDRLDGRGGADCLTGGADDDFEADPADTYIAPRPDADRVNGGTGADFLDGGAGDDLLSGGPGNDQLYGGSDRDVLRGGPGRDVLYGYYDIEESPARDRYFGGPGNDRIYAEDGARNVIDCGPGRDSAEVDRRDRVRHCEKVLRTNLYG